MEEPYLDPRRFIDERVNGVEFRSPRPPARIAYTTGVLVNTVYNAVDESGGGWWILFRPELHLGGDILVPDIVGWRRDRMPELLDVEFFDSVPDWVCEVTYPATYLLDLYHKLMAYARHGVANGWLVTPEIRGIEVWGLSRGHWTLIDAGDADQTLRVEPFEPEIDFARLWVYA
jgi:Uma2 family endonuclease